MMMRSMTHNSDNAHEVNSIHYSDVEQDDELSSNQNKI